MECNKAEDIVEVKSDMNSKSSCDRVRGDRGRRDRCNALAGGGIDSSLLLFFLLLVAIVCQSDCDFELNTLLWFFLLLVVLYNYYN